MLHLILKSTKESQLSLAAIDEPTIESFYEKNKELYHSLEITKDTFVNCWQAVYYSHMPELKGTVSPKLVDTIRFFRQHKVSGLQLVANYCQYNKHRTQLKDAFNPWVEFEQSIKGRVNTTEGVSIAESAFMGLLLMYSLGLRNAEACAVDYGDIKPMQTHPDCPVIWINKTTGYDTSAGKLGGKTRNADRIIPVPDKVAALIDERRQYIESQLGKSIDDYPIVCNNDRWVVRCSARELTNATRVLFQSIKIKASQMASINEDLQEDSISDRDSLPFEDRKYPTAYLFRRNFGTHLHILGLSEPEIEYVIGHDIDDPYETRNEFVNEEKLFAIKQEMDRRPLVNSDFTQIERIDAGERLQLQHTAYVQIPAESAETEMHITAKEPTDNIRVTLSARPQNMRIQLNCRRYNVKKTEYDCFVDTQQQYHKVYTKA